MGKQDIVRAGISLGSRFFSDDVASFNNRLYTSARLLQDVENPDFMPCFRLSLSYGLDHYLIPGFSLGLHLDYSFSDIEDISLEVVGNSNTIYRYEGSLLSTHTFGLLPCVYVHFFPLIEYAFSTDMPPSWDIYLYGGPRMNFHSFKKEMDLQGLKSCNLGWEIGFGVEIFLHKRISAHIEYSYYTDTSSFKVIQNNTPVFDGDLQLDASRIMVGLFYYF
mgnify:FL=1